MINEARVLARKLRSAYGYSPALNMAAAQYMEKLAAELEEAENKLGNLLYHVTGGRFSKINYTVEEMKRLVDDYQQGECAKCEELEQIKRERDAAIADLKEADRIDCEHCRWYGLCQPAEGEDIDCEKCTNVCKCNECRNSDQWEWRGMKSGV